MPGGPEGLPAEFRFKTVPVEQHNTYDDCQSDAVNTGEDAHCHDSDPEVAGESDATEWHSDSIQFVDENWNL